MVPLQICRFRLNRASDRDVDWLMRILDRESRGYGARIMRSPGGTLTLGSSTTYASQRIFSGAFDATISKEFKAGPRRRVRQDRDDEGLDEAPRLLDDDPADAEQAIPVEENESIDNEPIDEIEEDDSQE
jgi:hypothetical protein